MFESVNMKKLFITIISVALISLSGILVCTARESEVSPEGSSDISESTTDSGYVNIEAEAKKTVWIYFLIGGLTAASAITAAVVITKKCK